MSGPFPSIRFAPLMVSDEDYDEWLRLFANRNEVADVYAQLIQGHGEVWDGYRPINEAILRRWSMAGLRYVKTRAWKIASTTDDRYSGRLRDEA